MRSVRIFFQMMSANLRGLMSFKVDFLVSFFAGLLSQTIGLLFLGVLFGNIPAVGGWNVYEVAILYSYMFFGEGMLTLFFQGTNGLWRLVRIGQFDQFMTRPLPITLQIYGQNINLAGAGTAITGLAVIFFSFYKLNFSWNLGKALLLIVSLILGAIIRVNINFGSSAISMWLEGSGGIKGVVERIYEMGKYPLDIYPKAFRIVLLSLIPYAAISYVPATVLLGKKPLEYFLILPGATILCIAVRKFIFSKAMKSYEGAGN
ncbi:MAG: hypothetical protein HFI76_01610 [Lachnospiraceae bacterium]|nr:hypothetical protein [Lachnospiraceae bacterium]